MAELPWDEAIVKVLGQAEAPMHYTEIAERILADGLRTNAGATPAQSVAGIISTSLKHGDSPFQRVGRGLYILRQEGEPVGVELKGVEIEVEGGAVVVLDAKPELEPPQAEAEAEAAAEDVKSPAGALQAFGMLWRREAVMWSKGKPPILGRQSEHAEPVDFADQVGVYLLYDRDRVIYVGRAADTMVARLRAHTFDRLAGRWDRFSWFGLRAVGEDGKLSNEAPPWSHEDVIETMEALLIESLEPPLNRKRGDNFAAVEYLQVEDPEVGEAKERQIVEKLLQRPKI